MKKCSRCGELKPLEDFARKKKSHDGRGYHCRPCAKAYHADWYSRSRETERAKQREWKEQRRPELAARQRAYARENADRIAVVQQAWKKRNNDKLRVYAIHDAMRRRGVKPDEAARSFIEVLRWDPCCYCGGSANEVDHIVPINRGGNGEWMNLTSACRSCNAQKSQKPLLAFLSDRAA